MSLQLRLNGIIDMYLLFSFLDTPPLWVYSASKAGVMGLMRSLRTQLPKSHNATVNMVAPWFTSKFANLEH